MCNGALGGGTENLSELLSRASWKVGAAPHLWSPFDDVGGIPLILGGERGGHRLPAEGMKPLNGSQS